MLSLTSGTRLGPYEIVSQLGAGGMGEVYKATDTRLQRTIAIKVLPEHLASDPQRLARFRREAQTISSLNHRHICALHDIGDEDGTHYLVMEYVEGEALDQRLEKGPVPLDDALEYAKQIADALDKAHQQGIVHRDLKPANVMVTKSGVKLLDFGLAKLTGDSESSSPLSQLNTQGDSGLTAEGTIMGTFRYMAPEQVEGKDVDARTDIYALCLVIYEMITGKRAIDGDTQASLIAAILKDKPTPITELQPITPPQLDRVVQTGLEKDPGNRWQSAREVKHALEWIGLETPSTPLPVADAKQLSTRLVTATLVVALAAVVAVVMLFRSPSVSPESRLEISTPPTSNADSFALSPDGRSLVFVASDGDQDRLWLRSLASDTPDPLAGTEGASMPFWSPDSESIGFFANSQLKTVEIDGGLPRTLTSATLPGGGTWGPEGVILFNGIRGGSIFRISERGGEPSRVVDQPDLFNMFPQFLPDGRQFLFFNGGSGAAGRGVYLGTLDAPETRFLLETDSPAGFHPAGYLLFIRQGALVAQPFDPGTGEIDGEAVTVAEELSTQGPGGLPFAVSPSGMLAYRRVRGGETRLGWFDRNGEELGTLSTDFGSPAFSPDGMRVAAGRGGDVWVMNVSSPAPSQFTFRAEGEIGPVWSPDGREIVFSVFAPQGVEIHRRVSSGAGGQEVLLADGGLPADWSSDGRFLLYTDVVPPNVDIRLLSMEGEQEVRDYLADPDVEETRGQFSPNGRWIAYESNESGQYEIEVRPFPDAEGGQWRVSSNGGKFVRWSPDGEELYYLTPEGALMAVPVETNSDTFNHGVPVRLFDTPIPAATVTGSIAPPYDLSPDSRFLMTVSSEEETSPITLILNWDPENNE